MGLWHWEFVGMFALADVGHSMIAQHCGNLRAQHGRKSDPQFTGAAAVNRQQGTCLGKHTLRLQERSSYASLTKLGVQKIDVDMGTLGRDSHEKATACSTAEDVQGILT